MKIIILAGGSGSRLWPQSRSTYPKQFSSFEGEHSLLQKTVLRFLQKYSAQDFVIVTHKDLEELVKIQLNQIDPSLPERVICEPERKNTAPAILFALDWLEKREELDETFLVAPSDHLISPEDLFLEKVELADAEAKKGSHLLFGVFPTQPHTGYGYIQYAPGDTVCEVIRFIEKPSHDKAKELLIKGNCLWNSGVFVFQTALFFAEMGRYHKDLPSLSIDHALLEDSEKVQVIPLSLLWSDVGSWDSVYDISEKDADENVITGNVELLDTKRCLIQGGEKLTCLVDVEDLLVVDSQDALLIAKKGSSQKIRTVVEQIKERKEAHEHPTTYRPWGSYTVLEEGPNFKIKSICVEPGGKLSLQYHLHRSEHWVIIQGVAQITLGEQDLSLEVNESIFVPKEMPHRLENRENTPLEIIEIQVGDYVGEDDIVRLSDVYGRVEKASL